MTITPTLTCYGVILLTALCLGSRQYGARKIRHDHKTQSEGTQPDIDFEFETTKGFQLVYGDYDDLSEDVTLDVVHSLYDTRKGIVPNIVYQGIVLVFHYLCFPSIIHYWTTADRVMYIRFRDIFIIFCLLNLKTNILNALFSIEESGFKEIRVYDENSNNLDFWMYHFFWNIEVQNIEIKVFNILRNLK